jgi:hypothetical protein
VGVGCGMNATTLLRTMHVAQVVRNVNPQRNRDGEENPVDDVATGGFWALRDAFVIVVVTGGARDDARRALSLF